MYVLHSHWQPGSSPGERGRVLFWAETGGAAPPRPRAARARAGAGARRGQGAGGQGQGEEPLPVRSPGDHPFCAGPDEVRRLLAAPEAGASPGLAAASPGSVALFLPSAPGVPLPSPQLEHEWPVPAAGPDGGGEVALASWEVAGLWLAGREACLLLAALPLEGEAVPGVAMGSDTRFWHVAAGLVLDALASQKLVPALERVGSHGGTEARGGARAARPAPHSLPAVPPLSGRWLALLDSPQDAARLARLVAAMPPICRAADARGVVAGEAAPSRRKARSRRGEGAAAPIASAPARETVGASPRGAPAGALLESFIQDMADALARAWAPAAIGRPPAGASGPAARLSRLLDARDAEAGTAAARWLRALFGDQPRVEAPPAQLDALERSVRAWMRNLHVARAGDFRVAFRLDPAPLGPPVSEEGPQAGRGEAPPPVGGRPAASPALPGRTAPPRIGSSSPEGTGVAAGAWRLHYLFQARSDPSLLVPAAEIWRGGSEAVQRLGGRLDHPQESLLAALGYTARLFEPVARSLQAPRPQQLELSAGEAAGFLRETAPLLEQSGFGVLVPPWWNQRGSRLALRLKARPKVSSADQVAGRLNLEQIVEFQWELAVGDTALTRQEFEALVALKAPLVQLRGQWVQLDPGQVEAALRFWQRQQAAQGASLLDAMQLGLAPDGPEAWPGQQVAGLPVEEVAFEGWLAGWIERLREREQLTTLPQPAGLRGELRPYQVYGFSWLEFLRRYGIGACLADDMGLGKTLETIALLLRDKEQGLDGSPVLLVCPTSVVGNWRREVERFAPALSVWVHQGGERLRGPEFAEAVSGHDLVLTSYPLVRRDGETLQAVPWRGVILDEAQNIKNPGAQQTQAIRRLPGGFRFALTGTPVENRLAELWSIMHFLNPGYLGTREHFRQNYAIPIERYGEEAPGRQLRALVSPLILRRVKTDPRVIKDLPDKLEMKVFCNLSEEQASLYEAVVKDSLAQVEGAEGIDRRGQVLAMLMKLKQVCDHPVLFLHQAGPPPGQRARARGASAPDASPEGGAPPLPAGQAGDGPLAPRAGKTGRGPGSAGAGDRRAGAGGPAGLTAEALRGRSGKLDRLVEMLEEALAAGDRAPVFTQFAEMGALLHGYLPEALGRPALFMHGGVPAPQRDQMVARFQSDDGPPIFILSLKAGGVGLNLTRANHVFHFDRWWNPAVEDQATDRAFRIGQTRNVQVHKFVSAGTLEEAIDEMIESKRALAQAIVGAGESWLTELSTDQLRDLVSLRRTA